MTTEYETLLLDAYRGEVFGDAFFGAMATARRDAARSRTAARAATGRSATAARLRPLMDAAGLAADDAAAAAEGVRLGETVGDSSWTDFLEGLRDALADPSSRTSSVCGRSPRIPPIPCSPTLVAHEQAIDRFAELELEGRTDDALAVLHGHLDAAHRERLLA